MAGRGDDDFNDRHRAVIAATLHILNSFGRPAAEYLAYLLEHDENSDAEAWIAAYFEPVSMKETRH
jgi:hypothetical protein